MARDPKSPAALELLACLVPREVMAKAHVLAKGNELEEYVRRYMARRALLVFVAGLAAMSAGFYVAWKVLSIAHPLLHSLASWLPMPGTILVLGVAIWIVFVTLCVVLLLWWLERAALRERARESNTDG